LIKKIFLWPQNKDATEKLKINLTGLKSVILNGYQKRVDARTLND